MHRPSSAVMLLGLLTCGPGSSVGEGSEDGSTDSTTGDDPELDTGTTDEGETGSDPSECYGDGDSLDHDWSELEPVSYDEGRWDRVQVVRRP